MWHQSILDHSLFSWLTALALFLCVVLGGKLLCRLGLRELQKLADRSDWKVHGFLLEVLRANNTLLVTVLGMLAALQVLQLSDRAEEITVDVMLILLILQ